MSLETNLRLANIEHLQDTDNTAPREAPLIPCAAQLEDSPQRDLTVSQEPAASAEESTNDDSDESASSRVAEEQANIEADASYNPLSSQVKHAATAKDDMDLDIEGVGKPDNEDSDAYEPADAESESSTQESSDASFSPAPVAEQTAVQASDADVHIVSAITPITQPISLGKQGSGSESPREVDCSVTPHVDCSSNMRQAVAAIITPPSTASRSGFVPYETPLQYFRAYRFHPQFNKSVAGGLRSLTYSNKIDVKKEFCPDQLAGNDCARGSQCQFQHFESIQAPGTC
jgi:hypothetical protein